MSEKISAHYCCRSRAEGEVSLLFGLVFSRTNHTAVEANAVNDKFFIFRSSRGKYNNFAVARITTVETL
jgi:hypothetical protein